LVLQRNRRTSNGAAGLVNYSQLADDNVSRRTVSDENIFLPM